MVKFAWLFVAVLFLSVVEGRATGPHSGGKPGDRLTLVDSGHAATSLVVPKDASAVIRYAAEDLQYVVNRMSGANLSIVEEGEDDGEGVRILIGPTSLTRGMVPETERTRLTPEGFLIRRQGANIALCGGESDYGTLFAVSRFLHELGARFYMPGEIGEVIPERKTIAVHELNLREEPAFELRWLLLKDDIDLR